MQQHVKSHDDREKQENRKRRIPAVDLQSVRQEDLDYQGSTYSEVRKAIFENPYYSVWGGNDEPPLPYYDVTFKSVMRGLFTRGRSRFQNAAARTLDSKADLRWGPDLRGQRRIVHPNGVCLTGEWKIDQETKYTGYFQKGSHGKVIGRYSSGATQRDGRFRSLSLVGKIYPKRDNENEKVVPANFITQEDLGGELRRPINFAEVRNSPNTTIWRRGWGSPVLFLTGLTFLTVDREPAKRQLYEIAELDKPKNVRTCAPEFFRLKVAAGTKVIKDYPDCRDEIMAHIFEPGNPKPVDKLSFDIEVSDTGWQVGPSLFQRVYISNWLKIGQITFNDAVISYNGDFVIHFHHPKWRKDRHDPESEFRTKRF